MRQQLLEQRKMELSIEKAEKDMDVAGLQARVSQAELDAAAANVEHRRMTSPLDAVVVELSSHEGEWVQAGDPMMRLMRIDLLRVEGLLDAKNYRFSEIQGRPVQVTVTSPTDNARRFPARSSSSSR